MPDFTVARRGTDSSGRGIYATAFMWDWWQRVVDELGFTPTITQGAFMERAGGGAVDSAGYHDGAGTFDLRVWDLTDPQVSETIRTLRADGAAAWLRNVAHGGFTDPHIHFVLGADRPLSSGAALQWREYLIGRDGMGGPDYHPRPHPLVTTPPERDWFDMATEAEVRAIVREEMAAQTDKIADATAKALLNSEVIAKLNVTVREALRESFNAAASQGQRKSKS